MPHLAPNILNFVRLLRAAGLPVGSDRATRAIQAVQCAGVEDREGVRAALSCTLLSSHEDQPLFDQAFDLFWRDPDLDSKMRALLLPKVDGRTPLKESSRRLAAAFFPHAPTSTRPREEQRLEFDASLTFSAEEKLRQADFETMTPEEFREARRVVSRLALDLAPIRSRRRESSVRGDEIDLRASLARSVRQGGDVWPLVRRRRREVTPPVVVLADISGSMERVTRMLLHFLHGLSNRGQRLRVESFLFGTRLTRVTRLLSHRDADEAIAHVSRRVVDWGGGTRIGPALAEFNRDWSRRVLAQRARVLLITDGLDRDDGQLLDREMARLKRATRELIWLNPLLRYEGFEARPAGVRAMLPHVDRHLPVHNIASLADLSGALSRRNPRVWN